MGEPLDHPAVTKTENLSAIWAEVDDIGALDQGNTLGLRIDLGELQFAVRTNWCKILSFDDRERFFTHRGYLRGVLFHYYAQNRGMFRVVRRTTLQKFPPG